MDLRPKQTTPAARLGPLKEMHRLKTNGAASLGELREFFDQLRGRSPDEMVGIVSTSRLIQSVVMATAIIAAVFAVFTIGPYLLMDKEAQAKRPGDAAASADQNADATPSAAAANSPAAPGADKTGVPTGSASQPDAEKAAKAMGLDETKTADPSTNPLDNLDSLLDGVD